MKYKSPNEGPIRFRVNGYRGLMAFAWLGAIAYFLGAQLAIAGLCCVIVLLFFKGFEVLNTYGIDFRTLTVEREGLYFWLIPGEEYPAKKKKREK